MEMTLYRTINIKIPEEKVITLTKPFESINIPRKGDSSKILCLWILLRSK